MILKFFILFILIAFILVFVFVTFALSALKFLASLFFGKQTPKTTSNRTYNQQPQQDQATNHTYHKESRDEKTKVFDDDEGEYIDFEEIKDEPTR